MDDWDKQRLVEDSSSLSSCGSRDDVSRKTEFDFVLDIKDDDEETRNDDTHTHKTKLHSRTSGEMGGHGAPGGKRRSRKHRVSVDGDPSEVNPADDVSGKRKRGSSLDRGKREMDHCVVPISDVDTTALSACSVPTPPVVDKGPHDDPPDASNINGDMQGGLTELMIEDGGGMQAAGWYQGNLQQVLHSGVREPVEAVLQDATTTVQVHTSSLHSLHAAQPGQLNISVL